MNQIGPLFSDVLRIKGLEQKDLAKAINVSPQTIGLLLKGGADKWKLSYFEKACRYLHIHPKSFFENWNEGGNIINGNVDNSSILGNTSLILGGENSDSDLLNELRNRLTDKDKLINSLNKIISLQKTLLKNYGHNFDDESIDN